MRELKLVLMAIFVAVFVMGCGGSKTTDPDFSPDTPTMDLNYGEDTPDDDQAEPREDLVADEAEPEVEDSDEADTYTPPEPGAPSAIHARMVMTAIQTSVLTPRLEVFVQQPVLPIVHRIGLVR